MGGMRRELPTRRFQLLSHNIAHFYGCSPKLHFDTRKPYFKNGVRGHGYTTRNACH